MSASGPPAGQVLAPVANLRLGRVPSTPGELLWRELHGGLSDGSTGEQRKQGNDHTLTFEMDFLLTKSGMRDTARKRMIGINTGPLNIPHYAMPMHILYIKYFCVLEYPYGSVVWY